MTASCALAQAHTGGRPGYLEMMQLLLKAFEATVPCRFEWTQVDSLTGRARIEVLTCSK